MFDEMLSKLSHCDRESFVRDIASKREAGW